MDWTNTIILIYVLTDVCYNELNQHTQWLSIVFNLSNQSYNVSAVCKLSSCLVCLKLDKTFQSFYGAFLIAFIWTPNALMHYIIKITAYSVFVL